MAFSKTAIPSAIATNRVYIASSVASGDDNVIGGTGNVYAIRIDNSVVGSTEVYVKLYDSAAPTYGTTAPSAKFRVPAETTREFLFPRGMDFSAAGLSINTTQLKGVADTTSPAKDVKLVLLTD